MKIGPALMCALVLMLASLTTLAQPGKQTAVNTTESKRTTGTYTPPRGSTEHKAILDALRKEVKRWSELDVVFVVNHLKVNNGWAWVQASPQSPGGSNRYEEVSGLLHKQKGQWRMVETRPCCGECADDPDCADDKRYFKKLRSRFPSVPPKIFPED